MYEEKRSINWKSLILRILILALIVFLVIWVIQLIANRNKDKNNEVFNQNITTMKEAAENYYKSNTLPENVGEKDKMTLEEMIDNNLLMEFTDKNGSFCDEKQSYSQITKTGEEKYQLKVLLSCDDKTDYLVKNMTVQSNSETTEDETTSDDSSKKSTASSKEESSSKENNSKSKNNDTNNSTSDSKSVDEVNAETNNVSETDAKVSNNTSRTYYTYETKKVYSYTTQYEFRKQIASSTINYTCPEGYALMGQKCYKSIVETAIDATSEYYDNEEIVVDALEKIEDSKKEYTDTIKNTTEVIYTCPSGYTATGTGANTKCYKVESTNNKETTEATKTCPTGYTLSGNTCVKYDNNLLVKVDVKKECPTGYKIDGDTCVKYDKTLVKKVDANKECPTGYNLDGNTCVKYIDATKVDAKKSTTYTTVDAKKTTSYTTVDAKKSTTYTYKNATPSYYCTYGTPSGNKCTYCPSSYPNRSGNSCYKNVAHKTATYGSWYVYTTKKSTTPLNTYSNSTEKMVYTGVTTQKTCSTCYTTRKYYNYTVYKRKVTYKTTYTKKYGKLQSTQAKVTYKCSTGTVSGNKCKIPKTTYKCTTGTPVGTGANTKCKIANTTYKCTTGTPVGTGANTKCKIANTTYTCDKGDKVGTSCYYCATGTKTGTGASMKCKLTEKVNNTCDKGTIDGTSCYYCTSGTTTGTGANTTCKVTTKVNNTCDKGTIDGTSCYYCKSGNTIGTGKNTKCQVETNVTESCKTGTLSNGKCYSCPAGYTENKTTGKCEKTTYVNYTKTGGETTYSCPAGYLTEGTGASTKCYKVIEGKKSYYCEDKSFTLGTDNKCRKTVKGEFKGYKCPEGYALKDKKCYKTTDEEIEANKIETEAKYDYTWSNNQTLDGWEFTGNTRTITNESEQTIASPHTGLFDSDNLAKNIIVLSFLTMGLAFVLYLAVRTVKNRRQNIIIR